MHRQQIIITALCLIVPAGYIYNQQWPQTLETPLRQPPYNFSSMQYNMIFLATMLPISFASIPLGMLIDKIPLKHSCWIILGAQLISQIITAILFFFSFNGFYYVILVMRMIFGLTSQTTYTLNSVIIQRYIRKKHLDFVMSLCWTIPMLFDAANSYISTAVYDKTHKIYLPLIIGSFVALLSFICCNLAIMHKKTAQHLAGAEGEQIGQEQQQHGEFNIKDLKLLGKRFWFYVMVVFIGNCSMTPYFDNLTDMLVQRFGVKYSTAGILVMIPSSLCPIFSFIWIWLVKKYPQKRRVFFVLMAFCAVLLHVIILSTPNQKVASARSYALITFAFIIYALGYSGFLGLIAPNSTIMVPKNLIGTAYGCVGSTFALSMTIMPIFNGLITSVDPNLSQSYLYLQYVYLPIAILYLVMMFYVYKSRSAMFKKLDKERKDQVLTSKQSLISNTGQPIMR